MKSGLVWIASIALLMAACKKEKVSTGGGTVTPPPPGGGAAVYSGSKLAISTGLSLVNPLIELGADTVFSSYTLGSSLVKRIPTGFEDKIISIYLPKGYMAVLAANSDGTGEAITLIAKDSAIKANLPTRLRNNISYIRYIRFTDQDKKGVCLTDSNRVKLFQTGWYYGWSFNRPSFGPLQYVPMTWGKGAAIDDNARYLIERNDIDHLLSFNEPDNSSQSNVPVDTAVARYKTMLKTGLRLFSPACTQDQAFGAGKWQTEFMSKIQSQRVRIDGIAVHWYDWGNQTNNAATDSLTAERVFNRFKIYIQNVRTAYPNLPILITEFNANMNRKSQVVQMYFMKLSTEWLNTLDYVERYSFFFEPDYPSANPDGTMSAIGAYWKSLPTTKAYTGGNHIADATLIK